MCMAISSIGVPNLVPLVLVTVGSSSFASWALVARELWANLAPLLNISGLGYSASIRGIMAPPYCSKCFLATVNRHCLPY